MITAILTLNPTKKIPHNIAKLRYDEVLVDSFFNDRHPVNPLNVVLVVRKDKYVFHLPIPGKPGVVRGFGNENKLLSSERRGTAR
jgi:hypothetical protein